MRTTLVRHPKFLLPLPQRSSLGTQHVTLSFDILTPATQPSSRAKDPVQFHSMSPNLSTVSCIQWPHEAMRPQIIIF